MWRAPGPGPAERLSFRPAEPWPISRGPPRVWTGDLVFDGSVAASARSPATLRAWLSAGRRGLLTALVQAPGPAAGPIWVARAGLWVRFRGPGPTAQQVRLVDRLATWEIRFEPPEPDRRLAALKARDLLQTGDLAQPQTKQRLIEVFHDETQPDRVRSDALCALWRGGLTESERVQVWTAAVRSPLPELVVSALELWPASGTGPELSDPPADPWTVPMSRAELLQVVTRLPEPWRTLWRQRLGQRWDLRFGLSLLPETPNLLGKT